MPTFSSYDKYIILRNLLQKYASLHHHFHCLFFCIQNLYQRIFKRKYRGNYLSDIILILKKEWSVLAPQKNVLHPPSPPSLSISPSPTPLLPPPPSLPPPQQIWIGIACSNMMNIECEVGNRSLICNATLYIYKHLQHPLFPYGFHFQKTIFHDFICFYFFY